MVGETKNLNPSFGGISHGFVGLQIVELDHCGKHSNEVFIQEEVIQAHFFVGG